MAKAPDNSYSPMKPSQLPLGENEALFATKNKDIILEIARLLSSIGDLEVDEENQQEIKERRQNVELTKRQRFTNCWKKVVRAVCCVLDVLEEPSHFLNGRHASRKDSTDKTDGSASSMQDTIDESKKEIMLRGLYHILVLGSQTLNIHLLMNLAENLDVSGNLYSVKSEHAEECLREVEGKYFPTLDLIDEASDMLKEIAEDSKNSEDPKAKKLNKFNSHVARAQLEIQLCRDFLDEAKTSIDEIMEKVSIVKFVSGCVRFLGWGVTCYSLYRIVSSTSKPEDLANSFVPLWYAAVKRLSFPLSLFAGCAISGYLWLSYLRPRRAYELCENFEKMTAKRKMMQLNYLDSRLKLLQKSYPPSQGSV